LLSAILVAFAWGPGLVQGAPAQDAPASGGAIISKMLARYAGASTLVGSIKYTVKAGNQTGSIDTVIQYERPKRLYIKQTTSVGQPRTWLVTSDGKLFSYDVPNDQYLASKSRLVEKMQGALRSDGAVSNFDMTDVYKASVLSIGDRSAPLDIAIGKNEDLVYLKNQWATVKLVGKVPAGDREANHIVGNWRPYGRAKVAGTYEMFITDEGDLLRFVRHEMVAPDGGGVPIPVDSIWDVNLTVGGTPDPALFKIVK
jgi:hypothetical protein